jgi:hypothetical protein
MRNSNVPGIATTARSSASAATSSRSRPGPALQKPAVALL